MKMRKEQQVFVVSFLAPAFFLYTAFVAFPSVRALLYSLQKWDGLSIPEWVGLRNFYDLFGDSDLFVAALQHNLILMAFGGCFTLLLSLFFAALLHRRVRGATLFRVTFFFPNVISSVAISLLWVLLYSTTDFGVINGCLELIQRALVSANGHLSAWGLPQLPVIPFDLPFPFAGTKYLIYSIVPMIIWMSTGFYMVLFLAAMENIPETFYEAATLDGATEFRKFWHITLPLIREVLTVGLVFLVIGCLKLFDAVWIMENQWPQKESHVLATVLYQKVFTEYNVGYGSAVAVLLFVLVFLSTLLTLRLSRKEAIEY
ncbi:MAG: sugar ABC transporter permease [Candidatus Hydrogenedentes bacterium]|nr:sugar ABC transporter permease [Candidatus Hydrogenedentota bacterium]